MKETKRVDRAIGRLTRKPKFNKTNGRWAYTFYLRENLELSESEVPIQVNLTREQFEKQKKYLSKGKKVFVDGCKAYNAFVDREGKERYESVINAKFIVSMI